MMNPTHLEETDRPQVSVLMAVYNAGAYLEQALQSLQGQTLQDWELLCVDDASTDGSLDTLQWYASQDARIKVFRQESNQGQAVARNLGLGYCRGEYVAMLDADDWLAPDALEKAIGVFHRHPDTDSVVLRLVRYEQKTGHEDVYAIPYSMDEAISGYDAFLASLDWKLHGLYLVRRDIHQRYPFDTSCHLYSDDNTTRLHFLHSREVRFCEGTYYYRQHAESATHAFTAERFLYMQANLSMKRTLEGEGVAQEVLRFYEDHRWLNYIDLLWVFYNHRRQLTLEEQTGVKRMFRDIYPTFHRPYHVKFGYTWLPSYSLFLKQEKLYFWLKARFFKEEDSPSPLDG